MRPSQKFVPVSLEFQALGIIESLARQVGEQAAVHLLMTSALLQHAAGVGLIDPAEDVRAGAEQLARLHPGLALTDPAINHAFAAALPDTAALTALWREHRVDDLPQRPDGYLLGDLYQRISHEARRGRALCQTPRCGADLLLKISFERACRARGPYLRMIDPTCGTGNILVETFMRARALQWLGFGRDHSRALPWRTPPVERVTTALATVHGVDIDPFAVLLARYRLLVMARALLLADRHRPTAAELAALPLNVAVADALLAEDEPLLRRGSYDVVVMNPPYITDKDKAHNRAVRARYPRVCSGKFPLALPFHQLAVELLNPGGWCAQLTANSFMKREFGRRYVEEFLAGLDLYWVIDTSGAYIPGHGTPTVILAHRNQPPSSPTVATVRSGRGEPAVPADPAQGVVWRAISAAVHEREAARRFTEALAQATPAASEPKPSHPAGPVTQPSLFDLLEAS